MRQIVFSPDTAGLDSRTILQSPGSDEDNVVLLFMNIFLVMCIVYLYYLKVMPFLGHERRYFSS